MVSSLGQFVFFQLFFVIFDNFGSIVTIILFYLCVISKRLLHSNGLVYRILLPEAFSFSAMNKPK